MVAISVAEWLDSSDLNPLMSATLPNRAGPVRVERIDVAQQLIDLCIRQCASCSRVPKFSRVSSHCVSGFSGVPDGCGTHTLDCAPVGQRQRDLARTDDIGLGGLTLQLIVDECLEALREPWDTLVGQEFLRSRCPGSPSRSRSWRPRQMAYSPAPTGPIAATGGVRLSCSLSSSQLRCASPRLARHHGFFTCL